MSKHPIDNSSLLDSIGVGEEISPSVDILRAYDSAMMNLLSVPLQSTGRVYSLQELELFPVATLQSILQSRGKFFDTQDHSQLVQLVLNSQRIPIIFATPSNAWATSEYTTGNVEESPSYAASHNVHYPIMSLQRFAPTVDKPRYSRALRRKIAWTHDGNSVLQSLQPVPVTVAYQLDLLTLTMRDTNATLLYLARKYMDKVPRVVRLDHGEPWGFLPVFVSLDSVRDTSQLESPGERAEKILRTVFSFVLQGSLPTNYKRVRTVRKVQYEIVDETIPSRPEPLETTPEVELEPKGLIS